MITLLFALAVSATNEYYYSFDEFVNKFNKGYSIELPEYWRRKKIYEKRIEEFKQHNNDVSNTWKKGINEFADWTDEDLKSLRGLKSSLIPANINGEVPKLDGPLADSLNWCDKGACTPVKNQGSCGSCWAFAGTESIESDIFVETGKLPILAPQEFVDCAPNPNHCGGTGGCEGSTADLLFNYSITSPGIALEADYRYTARDGSCKISTTKVAAKIKGFTVVKSNDADALMAAVNKQPVAVNVAASSWSFYSGGIVSFKKNALILDHVVQLVGYGSENGKDYWLVRNSWGPNWGEKGFIRLERSTECGTDTRNQDGVGCKNDPKEVTVCGVNGILYACSYPTGGELV